jgi:hypothetical protein
MLLGDAGSWTHYSPSGIALQDSLVEHPYPFLQLLKFAGIVGGTIWGNDLYRPNNRPQSIRRLSSSRPELTPAQVSRFLTYRTQ